MEDLPVVRKIGDIIRVQGALVKDYKGQPYFSVNTSYGSSWCLFHSSDILLRGKLKGMTAGGDQDALGDAYSSSEHDSDRDLEGEMADGTPRPERMLEKEEKRKYSPYKFSGKSYSFDY